MVKTMSATRSTVCYSNLVLRDQQRAARVCLDSSRRKISGKPPEIDLPLWGLLEDERRCAWHGHWIGVDGPSRGKLVATAPQRQLHAGRAVVRRQTRAPLGRVGKEP